MSPAVALPVGVAFATLVSSVGVSGGILWMPFLLMAADLEPGQAVFTSLAIQAAGTFSGFTAYARKGEVDIRLALGLLALALPGVALGSFAATLFTPAHMKLILGLMVMAIALWFVSGTDSYNREAGPGLAGGAALKRLWIAAPMAVGTGLLSTGMGEWLIPAMRRRLGMKMSRAIATCVAVAFGSCLCGMAAHALFRGSLNASYALWAIPGVLIGGQIGPRITSRIDDALLKEVFIFVLTLVAIHLVYNSY